MANFFKCVLRGLILSAIALLHAGCASNLIMISGDSAGKISIDGSDSDWEGRMGAIPDKKAVIGVCRDTNYRYISFRTSDEKLIGKILFSGLTLWLNTDASEDKIFGIKYPSGRKKEFPPDENTEHPDETEKTDNAGMRGKGVMPGKMPEIDFSKSEVELIQGENDMFPRTVDIGRAAAKYKILISASNKDGIFFIEIGIPHKNGFIELPGDTEENFFGLGFETTKSEMPAMRGGGQFSDGDDDGPNDMGGGGGMPPGGSGGGIGGSGRMPPGGMGGGMRPGMLMIQILNLNCG